MRDLIIAAAVVALLWAFANRSGGGSTDVKRKGPGGRGSVFSAPGEDVTLPDGFDFGSNKIWISPGCDVVLEGELFEPGGSFAIAELEAPTLAQALELRTAPDLATPDNSVYGFLAYLIDQGIATTPSALASRVLAEASPGCAGDPSTWSPVITAWHADFSQRIASWVSETVGAIG